MPPKRIRVAGEKLPPAGVTVEEFDQDGIVYEKGGLKVIAFEVDYGDAIEPADGYLFDLRLMSACLSAMDLKFISL